MDIAREAAETRRLIEVFKNDYVGGEDDRVLRDKAKEIFERLDEETKAVRGNSIVVDLVNQKRHEFEKFVQHVYQSRHAPELKKYFFEYKKKHH